MHNSRRRLVRVVKTGAGQHSRDVGQHLCSFVNRCRRVADGAEDWRSEDAKLIE